MVETLAVEHPTSDQLASFVAGELAEPDAQGLEHHIDVCEDCRETLSDIVRQRAQENGLAATQIATQEELPISAGDLVEGRFRMERLIGVGGMGYVFEAHQIHLNQRVAIKFLLPDFARDASVVDRFKREARAAARLMTEHVGRVLDFGALAEGTPYLVMEYLVGETVDRRLSREGPFAPRLAAGIVRDATLALEEAHGIGIVHRDIKPANLFLARKSNGTEILKVLDFGIAKSVHPEIEEGLSSTSGKMLLGTPFYMAPEQLAPGQNVDARADVWALGCVLHQLLSGALPFEGRDLVDLMYAIARLPHRRLQGRGAWLAPIVDGCLSKAPEGRFESVAALRAAIDKVLSADAAIPRLVSSRKPVAYLLTAAAALAAAGAWWVDTRAESPEPRPLPIPVLVEQQLIAPLPSVDAAPEGDNGPDAGTGGPAVFSKPGRTVSKPAAFKVQQPVDVLDERL